MIWRRDDAEHEEAQLVDYVKGVGYR